MSPLTLVEALASVPDPRSRHGRRYPFVPLLCLVALGLLMGKRTLGPIARLGLVYGPELLLALGFPRGYGPVKSVLSRLLRRIDADALEAALSRWVASRLSPTDAAVVSTEWPVFREAEWATLFPTMRQPLLLDANGFLRNAVAGISGVRYHSVGQSK